MLGAGSISYSYFFIIISFKKIKFLTKYMSEHEPSAPADDIQFISFKQHLYPKVMLPEFDMNNYRINHIMNQYKYLDEERKTRNNLKKKYTKLSNACLVVSVLTTLDPKHFSVVCPTFPVYISNCEI
jgi:hypothetical protein